MQQPRQLPSTPARLLWEAADFPDTERPVEPIDGPCYWCGHPLDGEGVPVSVALASFADHAFARCQTSNHICLACNYVMSGTPPKTFRMWSCLWREDGLHKGEGNSKVHESVRVPGLSMLGKDNFWPILETLILPPDCMWFATLALTGQIHTLTYGHINNGSKAWSVRMERDTIVSTPKQLAFVLWHINALYGAGFSRTEIELGQVYSIVKNGEAPWRYHNQFLAKYRGGALFALACNFLRKEGYERINAIILNAGLSPANGQLKPTNGHNRRCASLWGVRSGGWGDSGLCGCDAHDRAIFGPVCISGERGCGSCDAEHRREVVGACDTPSVGDHGQREQGEDQTPGLVGESQNRAGDGGGFRGRIQSPRVGHVPKTANRRPANPVQQLSLFD